MSTVQTSANRDADGDVVELRALLRGLLRLQTDLHAVLRAKLDAMKQANMDNMRAAGARVLEITEAFEGLNAQRIAVVGRLAATHGLPMDEGLHLSKLIEAYPQPLRSELAALARALRDRMLAVADANRVIAAVSREMVDHFRTVFEAMTQAAAAPAGYARDGRSGHVDACVLDALG